MKSSGVSYTRFNITQLRWWLGLENLLHLTNWSFACISWNNPGKRQFTGDFNPCFYSKNERPIHHLNVFGLETYANSQFKLHTHSCTVVVHIKSLFLPNDISSTPSVLSWFFILERYKLCGHSEREKNLRSLKNQAFENSRNLYVVGASVGFLRGYFSFDC